MATIDERIEKLETKLKQEKEKKKRLEAKRKSVEAKLNRSHETKRKILVGAAVLAKVERGEWPKEKFIALMDSFLTRDDDRVLFGLTRKSKQEEGKN